MKRTLIISIFLINITFVSKAQMPHFLSNTNKVDSANSIFFKSIKTYDFALSYEATSYWTSNTRNWFILVLKGNQYLLYRIHSNRNNNGVWTSPKVKRSLFNFDVANKLIDSLSTRHFWSLNNDSLNNQKTKLYDATNYKFEVVTPTAYKIIESYAPEYFLEEMPWSTERKIFIACRDLIINKLTKNNN